MNLKAITGQKKNIFSVSCFQRICKIGHTVMSLIHKSGKAAMRIWTNRGASLNLSSFESGQFMRERPPIRGMEVD